MTNPQESPANAAKRDVATTKGGPDACIRATFTSNLNPLVRVVPPPTRP
jgi:hypothetical protein